MVYDSIYQKITCKGWELYIANDPEKIHHSVARGPIQTIEIGKQYLVLPRVKNPASVNELKEAIVNLEKTLTYPVFKYHHQSFPITRVQTFHNRILIRAQADIFFRPAALEKALDTLAQNIFSSQNELH